MNLYLNVSNIIVMADEAHRGQYGLAEKIKIIKNEAGEEVAKRVIGTASTYS